MVLIDSRWSVPTCLNSDSQFEQPRIVHPFRLTVWNMIHGCGSKFWAPHLLGGLDVHHTKADGFVPGKTWALQVYASSLPYYDVLGVSKDADERQIKKVAKEGNKVSCLLRKKHQMGLDDKCWALNFIWFYGVHAEEFGFAELPTKNCLTVPNHFGLWASIAERV